MNVRYNQGDNLSVCVRRSKRKSITPMRGIYRNSNDDFPVVQQMDCFILCIFQLCSCERCLLLLWYFVRGANLTSEERM